MAVIRDGETIYKSGYGFANLEWRQPIGPETVLGLGSVTKPFTAQAVLLLEQQGKLRLDDEITHYLPDAPTHGREITIAHLLTHTSGIANFVTQPGFWPNTAREDRTPSRGRLRSSPTSRLTSSQAMNYSYSNSAYVLLGRLHRDALRHALWRVHRIGYLRAAGYDPFALHGRPEDHPAPRCALSARRGWLGSRALFQRERDLRRRWTRRDARRPYPVGPGVARRNAHLA